MVSMLPPRLSAVGPDAELVFPMDSALSDLLLYLMRINIILDKSVLARYSPGGLMAGGGAVPWLVLEQPAGSVDRGGVEVMLLDRAGEDEVGS